MLLLKTIPQLRLQLATCRQENKQIGLVPTMGALHEGHLSLIKRAIAENDLVVVSIFVNPLQFSPTEDLGNYPRQLDLDLEFCTQLGVDFVFAPNSQEMNSNGDTQALTTTTTVLPPQHLTEVLCGQYRPGHFTGVATIVTKLLNIVQPHRAYFGQKDAQQLVIIKRLVEDLNLPVKIIACPIVRESSGLALSSRNQYLTATEKVAAAKIYQSLQLAHTAFSQGEYHTQTLINLVKVQLSNVPSVKIQYIELVEPKDLQSIAEIKDQGLLALAAYIGSTRLIDNIVLEKRQPIVAIDGPAGAGKSTVTRLLAQKLGLLYLDTGAMYRAVTWLVMESGIEIKDKPAIASLIEDLDLTLSSPKDANLPTIVKINNQDVTEAIRTPQVTAKVSAIAAIDAVRTKLVEMQQKLGEKGGLIAEGRDIGTNVFPDAQLKIFLTASAGERAKRRLQDLQNQGIQDIDLQQLTQDIQQRDAQDRGRAIAPLKKADDAIEIITDHLTIDQVIDKIAILYDQIS
ncbi:pantoate--beta-alanine ligase [Chondrocystis sp. NIES-4102]|nr:pantoate--beta-alanine ligase [Chondrocystis sp. NIES-4102]